MAEVWHSGFTDIVSSDPTIVSIWRRTGCGE